MAQKGKTERITAWIRVAVVVIICGFAYRFYNKIHHGNWPTESSLVGSSTIRTAHNDPITVEITAEHESESISLYDERGKNLRIGPRLVSDEIPYVIHWKFVDGITFDEKIPARKNRPSNWTSKKPAEGKAESVTFQVEPGYPPATLRYTLSLAD